MGAPKVQRVLFQQPISTGELVLAQMSDGTLCILHNGEAIGRQYWGESQMEEAVKAFRQLRAKLVRNERFKHDGTG